MPFFDGNMEKFIYKKEMILDVDKSIVLGNAVIDSPVLGKISPTALSGGVKTLILIKQDYCTKQTHPL